MDDLDELLRDEDEDEDEDDAKSSVETGDEDNGDDAKSNENSEDEASVETPEAVDAGGETAEDEPYDTADDDAPDDEDEDMGAEAGPMDMLRFIQAMPEADVRRHEQFRRSHFDKNVIKRCMTQVIEEACVGERRVPPVHNAMSIVMSGLAKMFLGELIAEARKIMAHAGDDGPIRPHHLREAHRKYYKRHPLIRGRNRRRLLK
ncbi:hypothetical protein SPRG_05398 [Saprolegnia parasitica CBS 223.65]|uniref:TAFII28-like protein domain-containing protein n=1 Tax=Saprolegnia parasitica (strain CBS 223.65) TaxID=695850 RepID=A0A067CEI4_SAPPC|nr:hypothetical protein SPRG_05398 [Saprolegnia parasitica CBS 223.65]KDO29154.1 hypothetical protein SPRG_05398 [Saprolegnia parasitica CBS 223.65]|eukprot:XP_012200033.1 hypothetical protein SPRG_05398 [Saprolegnia parasitica CBS 223.65]